VDHLSVSPPAKRFEVELKGMDSLDLPGLDDEPADPASCRVETTLRIGPVGDTSGDDFTLVFVTPGWLAENIPSEGFRVLKHTVVLPVFQWSAAQRAAGQLIDTARADSWEDFVEQFSRIAVWEYSNDLPPCL